MTPTSEAPAATMRFKLVVALVATAGLGALALTAYVIRDSRRGVVTPENLASTSLAIAYSTLVGVALLLGAIGLAGRHPWGRIGTLTVVLAVMPATGVLGLVSGAVLVAHSWGGPDEAYMPALTFGLAGVFVVCISVAYYLSFGPGRLVFSGSASAVSAIAVALAISSYVAAFLIFAVLPAVVGNRGGLSGPLPSSTRIAADLARVYAHVPAARGVAFRACPDAEIVQRAPSMDKTRWFGARYVWVMPVLREGLARFQTTPPAAPPDDGWGWVSDRSLNRSLDEDSSFARHLAQTVHVAVLSASDKALPEVEREGVAAGAGSAKTLRAGVHFRPGVFRGAVFIMDVREAEVVCQAPVEVHSADVVWYQVHGVDETAQRQLDADFAKQLWAGVHAALRQVSGVVKVTQYSPVSG